MEASPDQDPTHHHTEGLKVRLSPNNVQAGAFMGSAGAARFTWNWAVAQIKANQAIWNAQRLENLPSEARIKPLTFRDLQVRWQSQRAHVAPWHKEHHSKVYLYTLRTAARAHRDWMKSTKGFPRFKSKHRSKVSFTVSDAVRLEERHLQVPGLGQVLITAPDQAQKRWRRRVRRGKARIVSVTISRDKTGHWWAALTMERQCAHNHGETRPRVALGVDVGIKQLVVAASALTGDGGGEEVLEVAGVDQLKALERKLRRAQRVLSRKDLAWSRAEGSYETTGKVRRSPCVRREQARRRLAAAHQQVRDTRTTLLHQASAALVREAGARGAALVIEDFNVAGMGAGGGRRKAGLNRALRDASLGELRRQINYKTQAQLGEGHLLVADRWYPSSKTCAQCGRVRAKLSLSERTFRCEEASCGYQADRDLNAARNLAAWGKHQIQDGDRDGPGPLEGEHPSRSSEKHGHPIATQTRYSPAGKVESSALNGASTEARFCASEMVRTLPQSGSPERVASSVRQG